ncbi:MmgE/PrpD family protein [Bradyrhizobium sp. C-145]|uniref:MmgE/PrpD family protein n=1 Tax=Bradyrhizobium sp. C-145 TaxID=574727 RepID=UPI0021112362|nr:MmgE/PrpD family protein [Bradyrhizobium sp. C-145]
MAINKSQAEEADKSISLDLASHYASLDYERIPDDVRQEGKRLLLDTLGCMIAAAKTNEGNLISQLAADLGRVFDPTAPISSVATTRWAVSAIC